MRKLLTFLAVVTCLGSTIAKAEDIKKSPSDIATWTYKASSNVALGISSGGIVYNEEGLVNIRETFPFVVAPSTFALCEIVFSSAGQLMATATNFTLSDSGVLYTQQPRYPSPVWPQFWFNSSFSTMVYFASITISGIDSVGSTRTISLTMSTSPSNNVTTGVAFAYITGVSVGVLNSTVAAAHGAPLHLVLGTTNQIGLANDILSAGDIYAVWENSVSQSSITANAGNNTWTPNILPNYSLVPFQVSTGTARAVGNYYETLYRARQSPPRRRYPNRTNISTP